MWTKPAWSLATTVIVAAVSVSVPTAATARTQSVEHRSQQVGIFTWSGVWDSNWGAMTLTGDASGMSGTYTHDSGRVTATVVPGAGALYRGIWSEAPTYAGSNDSGEFEFLVSEDGKSFTGNWKYLGYESWSGAWKATCVSGPCLQNSATPLNGTPPVAPETGPIKGPKQVIRGKRVTFRYSSPTSGVVYQVRVDKGRWVSTSSRKYRVATKRLRAGKHSIQVRAVLGAMMDSTPSVKKFRVV